MTTMEVVKELIGFTLYAVCFVCFHKIGLIIFNWIYTKKTHNVDDEDVLEHHKTIKWFSSILWDFGSVWLLISIFHYIMLIGVD